MDDASAQPGLTGRQIPAKTLPIPTTVSPAFARSIATLTAAPSLSWDLAPSTAAEWQAVVGMLDAQASLGNPILASLFPYDMEIRQVAGVTVREITPESFDPAHEGRRLVHFHGGGYVLYGGEASTSEAVIAAHYARSKVISVDYRMPPDHPFPAAVDDAVAVWKALLADRPAGAMGMFGTSAGGGLTLATCLKLKALGLALPAAIAPGTPWADLTGSSDSYQVNAHADAVLSQYDGFAAGMAKLYAGTTDLADPLVSPVNGDFAGFPPTHLTTGTRDILLSDTVRVHRALRAAGVESRLEVYEAMSHAQYNMAVDSPESASAFRDIAAHFDRWLSA